MSREIKATNIRLQDTIVIEGLFEIIGGENVRATKSMFVSGISWATRTMLEVTGEVHMRYEVDGKIEYASRTANVLISDWEKVDRL